MKKLILLALIACLAGTSHAQWQQTSLDTYAISTYAVSGNYIFAGAYGEGIFLSTDNGINWTQVNSGLTDQFVNAIAVNGDHIFVGTDGGVFLSTNNGSNWIAKGLADVGSFSIVIHNNQIYTGTFEGVYVSSDNGDNWSATNNGLPEYSWVLTLAVNNNVMYAGTWDSGIYKSTNNGGNWSEANNGLPANTKIYIFAVNGNDIFAGTWGAGVFLSSNNGESWSDLNSGLTDLNIYALAIYGTEIFAGTSQQGVFVSSNYGDNWTTANDGLTDNTVSSLAITNDNIFAGTAGSGIWIRPLGDFVGIEDGIFVRNFAVYPNPASNMITIEIDQKAEIEILNSQGQLIKSLTANYNKIVVDISELQVGIYFIKVTDNKGIFINKFVKN